MAKKKYRLEVHYLSLTRPVSAEELQGKVREAIEKAKQRDKTAKDAGEEVAEEIIMRIALVSADRLKAYDRLEAQDYAGDWIMAALDKTPLEMTEVEVEEIDPIPRRTWISILEAADIVGALVPELCENWSPPAKLEDWVYVPDWIFQPLLVEARRLNPQWRIQAGVNLGNSVPGSQTNGENGTTD
jgi:hypothetical protein